MYMYMYIWHGRIYIFMYLNAGDHTCSSARNSAYTIITFQDEYVHKHVHTFTLFGRMII